MIKDMIIKSNLVKFVKANYNVSKFSFKKLYSWGKGEHKSTEYEFEVDGVKKQLSFAVGEIRANDILYRLEHNFNLIKQNNSNLSSIERVFGNLPIDIDELDSVVAKRAYDYDYFDENGYSDISKVEEFLKSLENAIKSKNIPDDILKPIKEDISKYSSDKMSLIKIIYNYFKFLLSKDTYRLILVTASRLHEVTQDNQYCGSNYKRYIEDAIKAVKKHGLKAEDDFKFYISTSDHNSWEQGPCIGYSSISHSEWNETLYLEVNYKDIEVASFRNSSAYGYY